MKNKEFIDFIEKTELEIHNLRSSLELKILTMLIANHPLYVFERLTGILENISPRGMVSAEEIDEKFAEQYRLRKVLEKFFLEKISEELDVVPYSEDNLARSNVLANVTNIDSCRKQNIIGNIF